MDTFPTHSSEFLIRQIGITLLHSLWLGMVLALSAGLVLILTKKSKASVRYNLLAGFLCTFILAVGYIFIDLLIKETPTERITQTQHQILHNVAFSPSPTYSALNYADTLISFLTLHSQTITLIWLLIIILKSFQLAGGLYDLRRLQRERVYVIGSYWEECVAKLSSKIGIARPVKIMQSGLVNTPMVFGHFKPVILVPLGIITSIPADQIEMVILHELAHIKRMDFLLNFLQHLSELLFFFNPGLLWVSSLIRKERENCCDDIALQYSGSRIKYITALLSFREYQLNESVYAVAFNSESDLVKRAKRIASLKNSSLKRTEKLVLAVSLLLVGTFTVLFTGTSGTNIVSFVNRQHKQAVEKTQEPLKFVVGKLAESRERFDKSQASLIGNRSKTLPTGQHYKLSDPQVISSQDSLLKIQSSSLKANPLQTVSESSANLKLQSLTSPQTLTDTLPGPKFESTEKNTGKKLFSHPEYNMASNSKSHLLKHKTGSLADQIIEEILKTDPSLSRDNLSFHITNDELILNDVKQTAEIHRQVISKFIKGPGDIVDFTFRSTR